MRRGLFIVIDGLGGTGKSTQIKLLKKRLAPDAIFTHEPGGAPRAEKIRTLVKDRESESLDPLADFFLFWAARAEHMAALIRPALSDGKVVVSDRFDSSTYAMQVRGEEKDNLEHFFWECRDLTLGHFAPDCYIILDTNSELAHTRREGRQLGEDRFDDRNEAYQKRVRNGYKEFTDRIGANAHVLDASRTPEEVDTDIWHIIEPLIR